MTSTLILILAITQLIHIGLFVWLVIQLRGHLRNLYERTYTGDTWPSNNKTGPARTDMERATRNALN